MFLAITCALVLGGLGAAFALGAGLKTIVWCKSMRWAFTHGKAYATDVQAAPSTQMTRDFRYVLIRRHHGAFKPCGAKSVRLQDRAGPLWAALGFMFVKTPYFLLWCGLGSLALSTPHSVEPTAGVLAVIIAAWVCAYSVLLLIEAIVWYVLAKDYAKVWGDIKFGHGPRDETDVALGDLKSLSAVSMTAMLASTVLVASVTQVYGGFDSLEPVSLGGVAWPPLLSSLYYVVANTLTIGDSNITPVSELARFATLLMQTTVLLTGGFFLSAIAARLQQGARP